MVPGVPGGGVVPGGAPVTAGQLAAPAEAVGIAPVACVPLAAGVAVTAAASAPAVLAEAVAAAVATPGAVAALAGMLKATAAPAAANEPTIARVLLTVDICAPSVVYVSLRITYRI